MDPPPRGTPVHGTILALSVTVAEAKAADAQQDEY
jgi:hypothetical protein